MYRFPVSSNEIVWQCSWPAGISMNQPRCTQRFVGIKDADSSGALSALLRANPRPCSSTGLRGRRGRHTRTRTATAGRSRISTRVDVQRDHRPTRANLPSFAQHVRVIGTIRDDNAKTSFPITAFQFYECTSVAESRLPQGFDLNTRSGPIRNSATTDSLIVT